MRGLPTELWMQIFQEMRPEDWLKQMNTCRLFHSLLEAKLYEDIGIRSGSTKGPNPLPNESQSMKFVQTLMARPKLFDLVRNLRLYPSDGYDLFEEEVKPRDNYWNHPVLWQLPCFPHLRSLELVGIHIDVDCYTAIRSTSRLEYLVVQKCGIEAALLDLQPLQGNTISKLSISCPKDGDGWTALMTPGLHTLIMENALWDMHMYEVLQGLLSCDLRRTLTKLDWTLEEHFQKELCQFIDLCVLLESLSIRYLFRPQDDAPQRSSHFEELSSRSLLMLSKFEGSPEYIATIVAGRSVHSVSLQLWDDTPKNALLALQLSKVPVTRLELSQGECSYENEAPPAYTGMYLEHVPETIEFLSLDEIFDKSWIPALSNLSHLQTIECNVDLGSFTQREVIRSLSEACPCIRKIFLNTHGYDKCGDGKWLRRDDGSWEHYPTP